MIDLGDLIYKLEYIVEVVKFLWKYLEKLLFFVFGG